MNQEDGASAVIVTLTLVVLFGMGALVIDVGNLYWERRQLQTGAEAAALAAAQDFAEGNTTDAALASARIYASANNTRDARIEDADFVPDLGASTITVTTQTGDVDSPGTITAFLASVLGFDTYSTEATAVAAWQSAGSLGTFPLIISLCELLQEDGSPITQYPKDPNQDPPAHPNPNAVPETIIFHQGTGGDEDPCNAQAGQDVNEDGFLPAGFGWLVNDGSCQVITTVVGEEEERWVEKDPGANPECSEDQLAPLVNTVVQIPVFNDFCRPNQTPACPQYSNRDKYRIETYQSFYLLGYKLGGGPSDEAGVHNCSGSERCIHGYFTDSVTLGGVGGGPDGGVSIVTLIG